MDNAIADAALRSHAALVTALRDPAVYPHRVDAVEVFETHISSVFLAGEFAYKLKKPVNLGFVDFSMLARRRHFCDEEIRLNRRCAPTLYLDVVPIARSRTSSSLRIGGDGTVIDYAVRMRRFARNARLDHMAELGTLDAALIDQLAKTVAAFHLRCDSAPSNRTFGTPAEIRRWTMANLRELQRLAPDPSQRQRVERLAHWTEAEFALRAPVFAERRAAGCVRECHGDLHLGNLVLIEGQPVPFDCIEFNSQLRFIDVMSDVAFTWMDLIGHGLPRLAWLLLNGYLEATGDYGGLATLRFYAVYRALVRANVAMIRRGQPGTSASEREVDERACARYLVVAENLTQESHRHMLLTCGVTGSGKTTVSQLLLQSLGAVRVRSDVERKRLVGIAVTDHEHIGIDSGLYDAVTTRRTYEQLMRATTAIVDAGFPAIVDATFLHRVDRQAFRALSEQLSAALTIVVCEATPETLRARVATRVVRGTDASDATLEVLAHQLAAFEAPAEDEKPIVKWIDTNTEPQTLAARCAELAARLRSEGSPRGVLATSIDDR
jgi:aminoglycoside phosphotransferase family enzyme/predicted kinase